MNVENELVDVGNVEITKVDKKNKDALADAVFEIQDEAGQVVAKITTDKKDKHKSLIYQLAHTS